MPEIPVEKGFIASFKEGFKSFFPMLNDFRKGKYGKFPRWTAFAVFLFFVYILNPFDLIPDMIPFFGVVDDASIAVLCLKMISNDIKKYLDWKKQQGS